MEILSYFSQSFEHNINSMHFLPVLILLDGIVATYFFSVLKKRTKKLLIFTGAVLSFFILIYTVAGTAAHFWGASISPSMLLIISSALSVLLYFGLEFLSDLTTIIGASIGGAMGTLYVLNQLGFFYHPSNLVTQMVVIAIGGILIGGAIYKLAKKIQLTIRETFERVIALKIAASAIGGATLIMFTLTFYRRLSVVELLDKAYSDAALFYWATAGLKAVFVIIVALSGMAVQALLLSRSRHKQQIIHAKESQEVERSRDASTGAG